MPSIRRQHEYYRHSGTCLYCGVHATNTLSAYCEPPVHYINLADNRTAAPAVPEPDVLKFCRDCRHCDRREWGCTRPHSGPVSLVTGEIPTRIAMDCAWERDEAKDDDVIRFGFERCGIEGKFFEPRD